MIYKHIAWDWNGTLLNDAEACSRAVSLMLEKRNMGSISIDQYRSIIEFPVRNLYNEAGFDFEKESYEDLCVEYINNYIDNDYLIYLQNDAGEVLGKFRSEGVIQHIVSASGNDILMEQLEKYGLKDYFKFILCQDNNQADSKAHLAKRLGELIECGPREVLFIGDTIHDFEVANEAGFNCALVANGHCSLERLKNTGAPVYSNLSALYKELSSGGSL
jgi:phosphoglycolate phosphatase